jgi:hypothetical protein
LRENSATGTLFPNDFKSKANPPPVRPVQFQRQTQGSWTAPIMAMHDFPFGLNPFLSGGLVLMVFGGLLYYTSLG